MNSYYLAFIEDVSNEDILNFIAVMASHKKSGAKNGELEQTQQRRYDRQIRLWGEEGQMALGMSHVCLLNASATGTETLKNLVLPGN